MESGCWNAFQHIQIQKKKLKQIWEERKCMDEERTWSFLLEISCKSAFLFFERI
jgi:hypothetical protein